MADSSPPIQLRALLNMIIGRLDSLNEEEVLKAYFQLQSYSEIRPFIEQYETQFISAIQRRDIPTLAGLIKKVEASFSTHISQEVIQVASPKERSLPDYDVTQDELTSRARGTLQAMEEVGPISQSVHTSRKETNRTFITRLVDRYKEKLSAEQKATLIDSISKESELQPSAPPEQILQAAIKKTLSLDLPIASQLAKDKELSNHVVDLQLSTPEVVAERIAHVIIKSPSPNVAQKAISEGLKTPAGTASSLDSVLNRAELVSTASAIISSSADAIPDYRGFFSALAQNGSIVDKAFAPIADVILAILPTQARENVAVSVMSSLWKKDTAVGGVFQKSLGSLFQSDAILHMIQKGNAVFSTTSKGQLITPAQSFLGDVITTVFHPTSTLIFSGNTITTFRPTISAMWVEIIRVDPTLLPSNMYQYYLSLLARRGAEEGMKAAAKKLGKEAAKKITAKATGEAVGGTLGSFLTAIGVPPGAAQAIGAWVGGKLFEKLGGFFEKTVGFIKGFFNFIGEPWFKDYGIIFGLILIALIAIPIFLPGFQSFLPFLPGSGYNQTVTDNAFVSGFGFEGENGPYIDCLAETNKTNPLCSMDACDPAKQDCRWPAHGFVLQGPNNNCPGSTHIGTQGIDIDPIGGETGIDVYATIDGIVEDAYWGCPDGTGFLGNQCGAMRGNYVIIKGSSYTLTFYHLSQLVTPVNTGDHVTANMVIGKMDQTGNSSGTHLHFGYRGPGSINSILPVAVPPCLFLTGSCACPWIETK